MNNIKRNIILGLSLALVGCATAPGAKKADEPLTLQAVKPSYDEKTSSMALDAIKTACPADSKWEEYDWKRIPPFANACIKAKDWNKVEKMGNNLATRAHLTPWGAYYLGMAAEGKKDYPRAIWMFELALKKDPKEGLFHYELARIHWEAGDDVEAVQHMKTASELSPNLTEAHVTMGQLAVARHDFSEAESYFQKALKNDGKQMTALLGMATIAINNKDYAHAEEYLSRIVQTNPRNAKALLLLATVQDEHLKKYQEALQTYKDIKRLNADKKLDEPVRINLDEKIQRLEKNIQQAAKGAQGEQLNARSPSNERKVE